MTRPLLNNHNDQVFGSCLPMFFTKQEDCEQDGPSGNLRLIHSVFQSGHRNFAERSSGNSYCALLSHLPRSQSIRDNSTSFVSLEFKRTCCAQVSCDAHLCNIESHKRTLVVRHEPCNSRQEVVFPVHQKQDEREDSEMHGAHHSKTQQHTHKSIPRA